MRAIASSRQAVFKSERISSKSADAAECNARNDYDLGMSGENVRRTLVRFTYIIPKFVFWTAILARNGSVTARPNKLYELNRCLGPWAMVAHSPQYPYSPYSSLCSAVTQPFLAEIWAILGEIWALRRRPTSYRGLSIVSSTFLNRYTENLRNRLKSIPSSRMALELNR